MGTPLRMLSERLPMLLFVAVVVVAAGGATFRGEHVDVVGADISEPYAQAIGRTVEAARRICLEQYGFDMPAVISVDVRIKDGHRRLFNDGVGTFSLTVGSEDELARPAKSGVFHLYGLCHEVAHLAMYRPIENHSWLSGAAAEGWAHFLGSQLVDEVYHAEGEQLWPDAYDYRADGTARLQRQFASAGPSEIVQASRHWQQLVEIVGPRGVAPVFDAWGRLEVPAADPAPALENALLGANSDRRLRAWFRDAEPLFLAKATPSPVAASTVERGELAGRPRSLARDDGESAGMRSIAGSGHAVAFETGREGLYLRTVRIYGSRYGTPKSPPDRFHVWLCDAEFRVIADFRFPLARFERGEPRWVDLQVPPTAVPRNFIVCAGFNPSAHKGVYVHYDTQGSGHSSTGIPGRTLTPFQQGDWMIRVELDEHKSAGAPWSPGDLLPTRVALYLANLIIAALAISGLGLLAARLFQRQRLSLRHSLLCAVLGLLVVCPLALAVANHLELGAVPVGLDPAAEPSSNSAVAVQANTGRDNVANNQTRAAQPRHTERLPDSAEAVHAVMYPAGFVSIARQVALMIALTWVVGTVVVLARSLRAAAAIRRLRRSLARDECSRLASLGTRAFRRAGLRRDVPIRSSPLAPSPLALGAWRGTIVLPEGLAGALDDDELVCVLAHEAAHIARRDGQMAVVQCLAVAAFWWNPLLHALNRRIHYLRECICDDYAVRACGDGDRLAAALVRVAEWCLCSHRPLAGALHFGDDNLRNRITRLTQGEPTMIARATPTAVAALLILAMVAAALVFVPTLRAQSKPALRPTKATLASQATKSGRLSYNDGKADGKRSIANNGEMIAFTLPDETAKIAGIRIHGARYGTPRPPKEDFMIYFLDADMSETVATKTAPYARFKRGPEGWVEIRFPKPIEVPREFWVCLDFRAQATKGVYVSIDNSTDGSHSRVGLPGKEARDGNIGGDWMIEAVLAK